MFKEILKLNNFLLDKNISIKDFLKKVSFHSSDFFLINDKNKKIVGVITLGDFKRNFFLGIDIEKPISTIANKNFIYINSKSKDLDKIKKIFESNNIKYLPVLKNRQPIKIIHLVLNKNITKIPIIINAGGMGKRLSTISKNKPKPLVKVSDKTLIELVIESFYKYGFSVFYFGLNYKKTIIQNQIKSIKLNIQKSYVIENKPLGTAGILSLISNLKFKNFIFSNCDIVINHDYNEIVNYHLDNKNDLTVICSYQNIDLNYGVCDTDINGKIISIKEKPKVNFLVNTGVYICNNKILKLLKKNQYIDFDELIEKSINNKFKVMAFPVHSSRWLDFGTKENFYHADAILNYKR